MISTQHYHLQGNTERPANVTQWSRNARTEKNNCGEMWWKGKYLEKGNQMDCFLDFVQNGNSFSSTPNSAYQITIKADGWTQNCKHRQILTQCIWQKCCRSLWPQEIYMTAGQTTYQLTQDLDKNYVSIWETWLVQHLKTIIWKCYQDNINEQLTTNPVNAKNVEMDYTLKHYRLNWENHWPH